MMRTEAEIQTQVNAIDIALELGQAPAEATALVASKDALLWALGHYTDSPTQALLD